MPAILDDGERVGISHIILKTNKIWAHISINKQIKNGLKGQAVGHNCVRGPPEYYSSDIWLK